MSFAWLQIAIDSSRILIKPQNADFRFTIFQNSEHFEQIAKDSRRQAECGWVGRMQGPNHQNSGQGGVPAIWCQNEIAKVHPSECERNLILPHVFSGQIAKWSECGSGPTIWGQNSARGGDNLGEQNSDH